MTSFHTSIKESWKKEEEYRTCDVMVTSMARLIQGGETGFHGVWSHMPMRATLLAKRMHAKNAVHLNIPGGVDPQNPKLQKYTSAGNEIFAPGCAAFPLQEVFDLSMRGGLSVAFLSGIQFDVNGNVNASVIGDYRKPKVRMPGGAGSAVLIPTARRAILWRTKHDRRTFVEHVDFVTTRGNVDRIVTPLCIFKYENGALRLESIHPGVTFEEVQENTAFPLSRENVFGTKPPTPEELQLLRMIDPNDYRNIEFRS